MKKPLPILLAAWAVGTVYFWPHYTYYRLERAIADGKPDKIAAYVDFPAFRESARAQIAPSIPARLRDITTNQKFAALSEDLAKNLLVGEIEAKLTPEKFGSLGRKVSSGYVNTSRFDVVTVDDKDPQEQTRLILVRHGLTWKLAGIELPPYKAKSAAAIAAMKPQPKYEPPPPARPPSGPPGFEGVLWTSRDEAIGTALAGKVHKRPQTEDWGIRYVTYSIPEHVINGVTLEVLFQMDKSDGVLEQVLGRKMRDSAPSRIYDKDVDALVAFFTTQHGKPTLKTNPLLVGDETDRTYHWEIPGTVIEVSHSAFRNSTGLTEWLFVRYYGT
jgi:hypothetical protein